MIGLPYRQHHRLEAIFQLVIGADGQVGVARADPDQWDAQFIAEEAQEIEEFPAIDAVTGQDVVQLVDHQHAHADLAQQCQRQLFHFWQPWARSQWRTHRREQRDVEADYLKRGAITGRTEVR